MRGNCGYIGKAFDVTASSAGGRSDRVDQNRQQKANLWPSTWQFKYCMPNRMSAQRNGSVTFYIATGSIPTAAVLYYTLEGPGITVNDFGDGSLSGSVVASSSLVSFSTTINPISGAQKQFRCVVRTGSITGPAVMISPWVTIPAASINISPPSVIYENGATYTWNVTYSGFASNTSRTLYWELTGTAANTDDISATSGLLATRDLGSIALAHTGNAFSVTVRKDYTTEGDETLIPTIRLASATGILLATGLTSTVVDTSQAPVVSADVTSVNEGDTINYTMTLPDVSDTGSVTLTYAVEAVSGTVNASDFVSASSGTVTFTNRTATLTQILASDLATEGVESFRLKLADATGSEVVAMQALSGSYGLSKPNATIRSHATWNGTTTYVNSTDTYVVCPALGAGSYYTLTGSYVTESVTYDYIAVYSGVGIAGTQLTKVGGTGTLNYTSPTNTTITIRFVSDSSTVKSGFNLSLLSYNATTLPALSYGPVITVADTSTAPVINLISTSPVNEGDNIQFSVSGFDGVYYYTLTGSAASTTDFNPTAEGSFIVSGGTSGTITLTAWADLLTEGTETFAIQIRSGSTAGSVVATSDTITLLDTSQTSVTVDPTSYNEGGVITFNVTGPDGTLYYSISGTVAAADFADSALTGSFPITGNSGTFTKTLVSDFATEGAETFTLSVRSGSTSGTVVATSPTITVNDTSVTTVSVASSPVDEGVAFTVTVGSNNGTLYYSLDGTGVTTDDFVGGNTGSFTVASNTGSFIKTVAADTLTEGAETFTVNIRSGSVSGTIIGTSSPVLINDTSLTPTGQNAKATAVYTAVPALTYPALDSDYTTLEASGVPDVQSVFGNTFSRRALSSSFSVFNVATPYHNTVDTGLAGGSYHAGVLMDDGRVLLLPNSGTTLKIYDPALNTVATATATLPASSCANGGLLLADGRIVLWPKSYTKVMVLSADASTITLSTTSYSASTTIAGGVFLPPVYASNGGTVYLAPTDAHANSFYNPTTNTISFGNLTLPAGHVLGGICPMWDATNEKFGIFIPPTSEIANSTATTLYYFYDAFSATHIAATTGVTGAYTNPISVPGTQRVWLAPRSYTASPRWFLFASGTMSTNVAVFGTLSGVLATTAQNYSKICHVPGSNAALLMMLPLNSGNTSGLHRPILFNHASFVGREVHGFVGTSATHPAWVDAVYLLDGRILLIPGVATSNMLLYKGSPHTLPAYLAKSSFFNT